MERISRGIHTQEFQEQAIRLFEVKGLPIKEATQRLSSALPVGRLKNVLYAAREGKLKEIGKGQRPLTGMEIELARVKKELAEVKLERDLPKKCVAYFAKESR